MDGAFPAAALKQLRYFTTILIAAMCASVWRGGLTKVRPCRQHACKAPRQRWHLRQWCNVESVTYRFQRTYNSSNPTSPPLQVIHHKVLYIDQCARTVPENRYSAGTWVGFPPESTAGSVTRPHHPRLPRPVLAQRTRFSDSKTLDEDCAVRKLLRCRSSRCCWVSPAYTPGVGARALRPSRSCADAADFRGENPRAVVDVA